MKVEEKSILCDTDAVLADSAPPVIDEINKRLGLQLRVADIDSWIYVKNEVLRITGNLKLAEMAQAVWYEPEVLARATPVKGAQPVIKELVRDRGWRAWSATARHPKALEMTRDWVSGYFPEIPQSGEIYCREPGMQDLINAWEIKLIAVGMIAPLLYVEDDHVTVKFVAENNPFKVRPRICMPNRGWNANSGPWFDQYRVEDWEVILAIARNM